MRRLSQMTCVKFTEVSLSFGLTWKIVLTERYSGPCFASVIGYPGVSFNDSEVNLKTCAQNAGVIMHELGHALGMSHEQARQDRDEYIRINWMHVPQDYLEQYHSSPTSYIGSREMGFVPYDYRSVMHYSADAAMQSLPIVNGQGVHDGSMGQRNDFSPSDVLQLRDMYQCDALDAACVDQDEAVGNLFGTSQGRKANCKLLKDSGYCQHQSYGETISYFCPKICDRCPQLAREGHKERVERAACADVDETVCQFLEDYCPGKVSGLEQYMSMNCQKRCCLQSCNNTCQYVSEEEEEAVAGPVVKGPSVAMDITFDCPRYESERLLQQRLQLRFSRLLGAGVTVTLLKAPSCLQGCQRGEARVEQLCCQECVQKCTELRKKWVLLTPKELGTFSGAFRVLVRSKTVDVPFAWENLVAYSTQHRSLTYVAAVLSALGILTVALSIAFFVWWRRVSSSPADGEIETEVGLLIDDEAPKDTELGDAQSEHTEHTHISQRELGDWLHQHEEANVQDFLPHSWCWRHKTVLVACVCLAALASSGFMIYVDLAEPASSGLLEDSAPPAPSSSAPVFKYMGCFTADMPLAAAGPVDFYDNSCMRTGSSCGGLPFYRLKTSDGRSCAEFCLSKGLDLSGILDGSECRCGASASHAIWKATLARPDLRATKVVSWSPSCRIDAMRLSGPSTDIFEALRSNDLQEEDLRYISGIVRGLLIEPPKPVPGQPIGSMKEKVIPFFFVEPVAQETKDAFREALDEVARSTCISFHETNGTESKLRVHGIGHLCEASQVGWSQGVDLHLGWCCTSFHLGAILHELGHALGLINEEQRSDRSTFVEEPSSPISGDGPLFYDFSSVMHGPATSLPVSNKVGVHDPQIGQRRGLSALDVLKLQEIYGCGAPPYDIKVGICQQLMRHCKSGPLEPWMSENCGETCEPPVQRWLGFGFAFSTPGGFNLNKPKDQKMLGDGFAVGISEVLGVSNTTVQVSPGEAKVEVACGCQGIRGRACRSCSTLEALLLRSSQQTLQRWLRQGGFAQLEVLSYRVNGEGLIWLLQDSRVQISLCFVGTLSTTLAIVQAGWYLWWTQKVHVDAEVSEGE
ncbi:unnamed protein product [Cladocopium goreaui]|nr:unnamed protein product [Cladocopium goreaui]